jgi:hypothetical protein
MTMADIRLAAAELELGLGGDRADHEDPLTEVPEGDRAGAEHPRGERRETLEAAIGRPLIAEDTVAGDSDRERPTDWKGDPD